MKRKILTTAAVLAAIGTSFAVGSVAQARGPFWGPGPGAGYNSGPGFGPGCGSGPGAGYNAGPGYGHHGYGHGYGRGYRQNGPNGCARNANAPAPGQKLTVDEVKQQMERRLSWRNNPNLKLGKIKVKDDNTITAEIVTKDNSLVRAVLIDRNTGRRAPAR